MLALVALQVRIGLVEFSATGAGPRPWSEPLRPPRSAVSDGL